MDPVSIVVTALAAGAAAGISGAATTAVTDAYQALKGLVLGRLRSAGVAEEEVQQLIGDDTSGRGIDTPSLSAALTRVGVDESTVQAAQQLLELLETQAGKFVINAPDARGLIVGDQNTQHNTFS
jgi:hypothetical protein